MVRDAGVVRTRPAKKGPTINDELTAAHGAQICRSKAARRSTADENGVELTRVAVPNIPDRASDGRRLKCFLNLPRPLFDGQEGRIRLFWCTLIHCSSPE
jgi:hypothetical protein